MKFLKVFGLLLFYSFCMLTCETDESVPETCRTPINLMINSSLELFNDFEFQFNDLIAFDSKSHLLVGKGNRKGEDLRRSFIMKIDQSNNVESIKFFEDEYIESYNYSTIRKTNGGQFLYTSHERENSGDEPSLGLILFDSNLVPTALNYERIPEKQEFLKSIKELSNGDFAILYGVEQGIFTNHLTYELVRINLMGDILWTSEIRLGEGDGIDHSFEVTDLLYFNEKDEIAIIAENADLNAETEELFMIKVDGTGNILFTKSISKESAVDLGVGYFEVLNSVAIEHKSDEILIVTNLFSGVNPSRLLYIDLDGNIKREIVHESESAEWIRQIIPTQDSGYIIRSLPNCDTDDSEARLTKIDFDGNIEWSRVYKISTRFGFSKIIEKPNTNILVTGSIIGGDPFLLELNSEGNNL